MSYIILIIVSIIGGCIVGWTSASNIDNNPLATPMIFHKIDPLIFISIGFIVPAFIGFYIFGFIGIIASILITWISSVLTGNSIHMNIGRR